MGVTECLERVKECLMYYFFSKKIRLCVVGLPNSGKTSFCKAYVGEAVLKKERPTMGVRKQKWVKNGIHGVFYDIGGNARYENLLNINCKHADALIFVVDASDTSTLKNSKRLLDMIMKRNRKSPLPLLVLCTHNDIDGFERCQNIALELSLDSLLGGRDISCYSISSITLSNFPVVDEWIEGHAK